MARDILNMSDEEILNLDPNTLFAESDSAAGGSSTGTSASNEDDDGEDTQDHADGAGKELGEGQGDVGVGQAAGAGTTGTSPADLNLEDEEENKEAGNAGATKADESAPGSPADAASKAEGGSSVTAQNPDTATKPEVTGSDEKAVDYKAEYEKLLAPFNANGRQISVTSVDDALTLMKMGANYNKKMAAIKPNLKVLKMLETNGLLDEEKISFLIDLEKKNPDAINKLIKDSGLDPMDLDAEKAGNYRPTNRTVDDREIELDSVLDDLHGSKTYQRTVEIVANVWDVKSKQTVANSPELLRVIDEHVSTGIYDIITAEVENERLFGRLKGLSDIEAYKQVGDAINARGGFAHLAGSSSQGQQTTPAANVEVTPKPKKDDEQKIKEQRRAASASKPVATAPKVDKDFNPLALSDAEFQKLGKPHLM